MPCENISNDSQCMAAMLISISLLFLVTQVPAMIIAIFHKTFQNLIIGCNIFMYNGITLWYFSNQSLLHEVIS